MYARTGALEHSANFFHYFIRLTALLENIFYRSAQSLSVSFCQVFCSEDDDWNVRAFWTLAQMLDELETIHLGHHEVE